MTRTHAVANGSSHHRRHHQRRSPAVTLDPMWIDETTFTLAQIRRARARDGVAVNRH